MSQHEFEHYLSLLSRLLHLTEAQRADIADELRDHLEERTAALVAAGTTPEEAIRRAVEEFGDAAALARNLTRPQTAQRRRRLARWGLGAAIAAAIATFAIWPTNPPTITSVVVAQDPKPAANTVKPTDPATQAAERRRTMVEKKLDEDGIAMSFVDTPLREVLSFVSDAIEVPILIDRKRLEEEGISDDQPLSLMLKAGTVSTRTALELILNDANLSFSVREGVVIVTTRSQESQQYEVRVYPCQDLLNAAQTAGGEGQFFGGGGAAGGFGPAPMGGAAMPGIGATPAPPKGAGGGGLGGTAPRKSTHPSGEALRDVIMSMTGANWIDAEGEGGDLREYGGMMIVRHKQEVHRRIEELFARMRETQRKP